MSARDDLIAALDAYIAGTGGGRAAVRASPTTPATGTGGTSTTDRLQELADEEARLDELEAAGIRLRDIEAARLEIIRDRVSVMREATLIDDDDYAKALKSLQAQEAGLESGIDAARRFAGITDQQNSIFAKMAAGGTDFLEGFGKGLGSVVNPLNIMTSTIDKVVEATVFLAMEQDQAVVNFRRATGASGEFDGTIRGLERSLFTAGVSAAEAGQSVQTLFLNVSDFTEMSGPQQEELAKTTAVLNELGVNADNTAQNLQFATKTLGMTTTEATKLQRELFTFAQDLGVSADKIAQDFQKFGPQIAALGSEGVDAFKQLEMQAKATGLAIDELVNITEQFNKFDTAAQAVGKLNAMLGGPFLNSLEMVNETNPARRMELLKNAVDRAGLSFDQMDFYQRKAIASSMGLNEQQLALLMRGEFDVGPPPKTAEELANLAEQTAQFNTLAEEMKQMGMALAISFGPVVSILKEIVQVLQVFGKATPLVAAGIGAVTVALGMYKGTIEAVTMATVRQAIAEKGSVILGGIAALALLVGGLTMLDGAFRKVAIGVGLVVAGVVALSVAEKTTVILGAVGLVVSGIAALVHAFTVGNSPSLVQAFMMVAAAIPFMTLAMLGLMPLLPALLLMVPPLVFAFVMLSDALSETLSDQFVNNLQLMAVEVANIVASINELSATKAVAFTATMAATTVAAAATGLAGGVAPAAPAAPAPAGPPPVININLSIDGNEFATVVNSVEVSKYGGGTKSAMYDSIIGMIEQGLVKG